MNQTIKGNLYILPTTEKSRFHLVPKGQFETVNDVLVSIETDRLLMEDEPSEYGYHPAHLYLTIPFDKGIELSHIEEGDWYLFYLDEWVLMQCQDEKEAERCNKHYSVSINCKKVIATTNDTLVNLLPDPIIGKAPHYFPTFSQEFLREVVDNYKGEDVMEVEVELKDNRLYNTNPPTQYDYSLKLSSNNEVVCSLVKENMFDKDKAALEDIVNFEDDTKIWELAYKFFPVNFSDRNAFVVGYKTAQSKLYTQEEVIEFGKLVLDTFHSEGKTKSNKERLPRIKYNNWVTENLKK